MPLLEQAADCPDYDPQLDVTLPPSRFLEPFMERIRTSIACWSRPAGPLRPAAVARPRRRRARRPDPDIAADADWRREPMLIGYLVTVACERVAMDGANRVLQAGPVSPAARQALDAELALHDTMEGYTWALRSERAFSLSSVREFPGSGFWLTRGFTNDLMLRLLELFDRHLEDASRPYAEVVAGEERQTSPPGGGPNPYGALVTLLEPSLAAAREPAERTRAMSRSLRILNALQARVPPAAIRRRNSPTSACPRKRRSTRSTASPCT